VLRSTGGQTMFPPSLRPSGERVTWDPYKEPAQIDAEQLMRAAAVLAAAALLLRHFPDEGGRFHAYAAAMGTLLRCDVAPQTVKGIVAVFTTKIGSRSEHVCKAPRR
jgi:hypothetical protein